MRFDRRFLYAGVFLVVLGTVMVTALLITYDISSVSVALRAWPVALIAIGAAIALRRTRVSLPAGVLGAALPGLVLGGAFIVMPPDHDGCGRDGFDVATETRTGSFTEAPTISLTSMCGAIIVGTAPGNGWSLEGSSLEGRQPVVTAASDLLVVESRDAAVVNAAFAGGNPVEWQLAIPAGPIRTLDIDAGFGRAEVDLTGARIERLGLQGAGAFLSVDAAAASLGELDVNLQFSQLLLHLTAGADTRGTLRVAASNVILCVPDDLGLRVHTAGDATEVVIDPLDRGGTWESPNYATATHHADIEVLGSFSEIEIESKGACL